MDYRQLGSSGLRVSSLTLGTMTFGGHGNFAKVGFRMRMGDGPNMEGLSRHHVIEGCEASLRRLRTDHIDLYQVHEWDGSVPLEETLGGLDQLVRDGKVRYVGVSNYASWQLMKALGVSQRDGLARFVSQQIYYSLQERSAEYELI